MKQTTQAIVTTVLISTFLMLFATTSHAATPACVNPSADSDGDGWGWEDHRSCKVVNQQTTSTNTTANNTTGGPCAVVAKDITSARSQYQQYCSKPLDDCDPIDGLWYCSSTIINNHKPAVMNSANSQSTNTNMANGNSNPVCRFSASDENNDGWGWENARSCVVTSASSNTASTQYSDYVQPPVSAASVGYVNGTPVCLTDSSDAGNDGFGYEKGRTCKVVNGVTATRNKPLLNRRVCEPWLEIGYGNYRLQNNTWNDSEVYSDNWFQCIELGGSTGNYIARWDYNWLARHEGNEYAVKSYPQVYYGRKSRYNVSGTVAQTGLPVNINNMPRYTVDFDFSETGNMERNVALESFFHTSCDAEEYNKQFEMMVWVGVPTVRTPGTLLTTVTLSNHDWDVYVNPQLGWSYVAFVAKNPFNKGTLDWNAFVNWSRNQGPAFGVPYMAKNTCMGAIELGTETFWGAGTFTLKKFDVRRN